MSRLVVVIALAVALVIAGLLVGYQRTVGARLYVQQQHIKALTAEHNREFDAFVNIELEAWWDVAGGLVSAILESPDRREVFFARKDEFNAMEKQHMRFAYLMNWLHECCLSTYTSDMPRKLNGKWINVERSGVCPGDQVCRRGLADALRRI